MHIQSQPSHHDLILAILIRKIKLLMITSDDPHEQWHFVKGNQGGQIPELLGPHKVSAQIGKFRRKYHHKYLMFFQPSPNEHILL